MAQVLELCCFEWFQNEAPQIQINPILEKRVGF